MGSANHCPLCATDKYQKEYGALTCNIIIVLISCFSLSFLSLSQQGNTCPFPTTSLLKGQTSCTGYSLKTPASGYYIIGGVFLLVYLACVSLTGLNSLPLIAFSFFPALDVISDILYLANTGIIIINTNISVPYRSF